MGFLNLYNFCILHCAISLLIRKLKWSNKMKCPFVRADSPIGCAKKPLCTSNTTKKVWIFSPNLILGMKEIVPIFVTCKDTHKNNSDIFNCCSPFFSVFWNVIVTYFSKSQKNPKGCYFWYFIGLPHFSPVWNTFLMCNSK